MGNSSSSAEVATKVASFGKSYETYATSVSENGLDGQTLFEYEDFEGLLDDLEITKKLHRIRLTNEFALVKSQDEVVELKEPEAVDAMVS